MNAELLYEALSDRNALEQLNRYELEKLVDIHPYFSIGQLLLAKKQREERQSDSYQKQREHLHTFYRNPWWLYYQLELSDHVGSQGHKPETVTDTWPSLEELPETPDETTDALDTVTPAEAVSSIDDHTEPVADGHEPEDNAPPDVKKTAAQELMESIAMAKELRERFQNMEVFSKEPFESIARDATKASGEPVVRDTTKASPESIVLDTAQASREPIGQDTPQGSHTFPWPGMEDDSEIPTLMGAAPRVKIPEVEEEIEPLVLPYMITSAMPYDEPGYASVEAPGRHPAEAPQTTPAEAPEHAPEEAPHTAPVETPGASPNEVPALPEEPGQTPETQPGHAPEGQPESPGATPEGQPEPHPEEVPHTPQEGSPESAPEEVPGFAGSTELPEVPSEFPSAQENSPAAAALREASLAAVERPANGSMKKAAEAHDGTSAAAETPTGESAASEGPDEARAFPTGEPAPFPFSVTPISREFAFEPLHTVDYFASQGIRLELDEHASDKLSQHLKSFTEWLRTMKRVSPLDPIREDLDTATEAEIQHLAAGANHQREAIVTESMALVWVQQGKIHKAIEVYNKLSLQHPEKRAYFVAKIEQLNRL